VAGGHGGTLTGLASGVLVNVAYASAGTAVYTISMDWSRAGSAGSDFTVQDSLVHLCSQLARVAALGLAGALGTRECSACRSSSGWPASPPRPGCSTNHRPPRHGSKRRRARPEHYATSTAQSHARLPRSAPTDASPESRSRPNQPLLL
jgi:hypothetical protein